jgi:hypothetical protein
MILCDDILFWEQHRQRPELLATERIEGGYIIDISRRIEREKVKAKKWFAAEVRKLANMRSNTLASFRGDK